jgi:MscS family membrane protein
MTCGFAVTDDGLPRGRPWGVLVLTVAAFTLSVQAAPEVSPDREDTPRAAMMTFLRECRAGDYRDAAAWVDLDALATKHADLDGAIYARHLKIVLDRTLWVDVDALSDNPEGQANDGLPPGVDRVGSIATSRGAVDVLLERSTDGIDARGWRLAGPVVRRLPALYEEFGYGWLGDQLPESFFTIRFLEVALWQWLGVAAWIAGASLAALAGTAALSRVALPLAKRTEATWDDRLIVLLAAPVRAALALAVFSAGVITLGLAVPVRDFLGGAELGLAIVVGTWMLSRCVQLAGDVLSTRLVAESRSGLISSVTLGRKVTQAALVALASVALLHAVGVNVTGVVAGLGVGGLAVALAAQKTVENLFGGLTLAADQPVRVGDFCRWGDRVGTIEEIGLRSTRIRTLDRTVVTVPNSVFSQLEIENFARRDRIRLAATIGVRYETSPDQLRFLLEEIRHLLLADPMITPDPARVRFTEFGASSLNLEIFAYVRTSDYNEFLRVREDVMLRIMDAVEAAGSGFAFPSRTVYFGRDTGLDAGKSVAAEKVIRALRHRGDHADPNRPPETAAAVEAT